MAQFTAAAGTITVDQLDVTGSIGVTSQGNATIVNANSVDLKASNVGGDLDVTATAGNITDSAGVIVAGMAQFTAAAGTVTADQLDVTGSIGVTSQGNATIVNANSVDLKASNVGGDLDVTATAGNITDSAGVTVAGMAQFTAAAGTITVDQLDVTGSIGVTSQGNATIVNANSVDLKASNVGGDLDVTATAGNITDSAGVIVAGMAQFTAAAGTVTADQLDVTGSIGVTSQGNATIVNANSVDLKASNVGGDLDVTATAGNITDSAGVTVAGMAQFTAAAGTITVDQLDVTGSIGVTSQGNATIVNANSVDLKASNVGGDLDVTATAGNITDSAGVIVAGMAQFTAAAAGTITADQLDVTGSIGVTSQGNATIVNANSVDLKASNVGGDLDVTATVGNITDSAGVIVAGMAQFTAAAGTVTADQLDVTGSIGVTSQGTATIVNANSVDLKASNVGGDLDVTATAGNITDSAGVTVAGMAQFTAAAGIITVDQLDVTGSIGVTSQGNVTIVNANSVDLKASNVGGDLDVTATAGNITDSAGVTVAGMAQFTAAAGTITVDQLDVTGSIGVTSQGNATIVNANSVDLKASNVGGDLDVTATAGNITDSAGVIVAGMAQFTAAAGTITVNQLDVTGSIGVTSQGNATIVNANSVDLKSSNVGGDLAVTATAGNITDSAGVIVAGMAQFTAAAGTVTADQLDVTGSIGVTSQGNATIVNANSVDLKASNVGGDLDVTATAGNITDSAGVIVAGMAQFTAAAGTITVDQLDVTGSIGVTSQGNATIVNASSVDLKASNVGGDLDVTATAGNITDSAGVIVAGMAQSTAAAGTVTADQLDVTGSIGVTSQGNATIVNANSIDLKASNVGGDLDVTATAGNITDSAGVIVAGMAQFTAAAGTITVNQLDVTGSIGVTSQGNATIVNANSVDLKSSNVGGDLDVTATAGNITDSAGVIVAGMAQSTAAAGTVTADQLDVTGSIGVTSQGNATIVNANSIDLKASNVGGDLDVTATAGNITDSAGVIVAGMAQFTAAAGTITVNQLDVTGSIGVTSQGNATIVNANSVDLKSSNVGGDLDVTATAGNITDSAGVIVAGMAQFTAAAGTITVNQLDVTGSIGVTSQGNATIVNANSVDLKASNVGGDLDVTSPDDITQSAAIMVAGTTTLFAVDDICLVIPANDFMGEVIATANTIELVDVNNLQTGAIMAVDDIFLRAGAGGSGALTLNGNLITSDPMAMGQVLLQSAGGVSQISGNISTNELLLGGDAAIEGAGFFNLVADNSIERLAANLENDLFINNNGSILVAKLIYGSDCGTMEPINGLEIGGDLEINVNGGNLEQTTGSIFVAGATIFDVDGNICLIGGDCDGDGNSDNDFNTVEIVNAANAEIFDANQLIIVDANVVEQFWIRAGDADTNVGSGTDGVLIVDGNINATTAIFQASDGIVQDETASVVAVDALLLGGADVQQSSGNFELDGNNIVGTIAAILQDSLTLVNTIDLLVVKATFTSVCDPGIMEEYTGLSIGGDLTLTVDGSSEVGPEDGLGDIGQTDAPVIVGGLTTLFTTGDICLIGGDCDPAGMSDGNTNNDFSSLQITTAIDAEVLDANSLTIVSANVSGQLWLAAGNDDALPGDGAEGVLNLNGNVDAMTALLQASEGVSQDELNSVITVNQLLLGGDDAKESSGNFVLDGNNAIDQISAALMGSLTLVNSGDLLVTKTTFNSVCDAAITEQFTGLNIGGGLSITIVNGGLDQDDASVLVVGATVLDVTGDICLIGGDCDGDGNTDNDFNTIQILNAENAEILDINNLVVVGANVTNQLWLAAGDGFEDDNDNGILDIGEDANGNAILDVAGELTIDGDVNATTAILQASQGVTQNEVESVINVNRLLLGGDDVKESNGNFVLDGINVVNEIAATLLDTLTLVNATDLLVVKADYTSACDDNVTEPFAGLNIGGDLNITVNGGSLGQTAEAPLIVVGDTVLSVTGEICLIGGDCDGDTNSENDFSSLRISSAVNAEVFDANDLVVVSADVLGQLWLVAGNDDATVGDNLDGTLTLNGNIDATTALLQASEGVVQDETSSVISVDQLFLGGSDAQESSGNFELDGDNIVVQVSANLMDSLTLVNTLNLEIVKATFTSVCNNAITEVFAGLSVGANLNVTVIGGGLEQSEEAPVVVGGNAVFDTTGDICLIGGDCDGDGNSENDLNSLQIVNAANAEILDSNNLTVVSATVGGQLWLAAGNDDATPGDGADGLLTLNGDINATIALLQASEGIDQDDLSSIITVNQLLLGGNEAKESTGNFVLDGNNNVMELAAQLNDSLVFVNGSSINISQLTYTSVCDMDLGVSICGLDIGQDLELRVIGDINQTAAIRVGNDTVLMATGDICLTGGDCDGDGLNDNFFGGEIDLDAGGEIVFATTGTLTITPTLVASGGNLRFIADMIDIQANIVADQLLLESGGGVELQDAFFIDVTDLLLSGNGNFDLFTAQANQIDNLAAAIDGDLQLSNAIDLTISKLVFVSDCGNIAIDGVNISGNAEFTMTGSLGQTNASVVVFGNTVLNVTGDICLIGGDCDGDGNTDNDFNTLEIVNAANAEVLDINNLTVVSASVAGQLWLAAGDGFEDGNDNGLLDVGEDVNGNGILDTAGALTIQGNIDATTVLLQASQGVAQDELSSVITTNQLLLGGDEVKESNGDFELDGNNSVSSIAATILDSLTLVNTVDLTIVKATYNSICDLTQSEDFGVDGNDLGVEPGVAGLNIGGNLDILITGGDLAQTDSAPVIVVGNTLLNVSGDICLIGGDCDGDGNSENDFSTLHIVNATNAEVHDANELIVSTANVTNQLWLAAGNDDAMPGDGLDGALTLDGNITATTALLQASEGATQTAGVVIAVDNLLLGGDDAKESSGDFVLDGNNVINQISADLMDSLTLVNTVDLLVVKQEFESICNGAMTEEFTGLDIGGDLMITVTGSLSQSDDAPVVVVGDTVLDVTENICLIGGDCDGDGNSENDFETLRIVSATNAEILDANDLMVTSADVANQLWLAAGNDDMTLGDGVDGALSINGNITATTALLQASEGAIQTAGVVTVDQLLLGGNDAKESSGDFVLDGDNVINLIAATLRDSLTLVNTVDLLVVKETYEAVCNPALMEEFAGIEIGGNLIINVTGNLSQSDSAPVVVFGDTLLNVSENICLIGGDCDGDGNSENDFHVLQIIAAENAEILDANNLIVSSAVVTNQLWLAAGDDDATPGDGIGGALTFNGDINATTILLQASEGAVQSSGAIAASQLMLGGDEANESAGNFVLDGDNAIDRISAALMDSLTLVNTIDLLVVKSTYASTCDPAIIESFDGLQSGGDLAITVNGGRLEQSTAAPVVVAGNTVLNSTADICLIGGDCDGDGNSENDFNTLQITAQNAEVLDANDLTVGVVNVVGQLFLGAGDDDAVVGDGLDGRLTFNGNINANQALFQASEGAAQLGGTITVDQLLLGGDGAKESSGNFVLTQANFISEVSANLLDSLELVNSIDLMIVKSNYTFVCDPSRSEDFGTDGGDAGTEPGVAGLNLGGDLQLVVIAGDLEQSDAPVVVSGNATLSVSGDICLIGGDCDADGNSENDFNSLEIVNATNAEIADANDLLVNDINVTNQLWLVAGDDDGNPGNPLDGAGTLTLNGTVNATQALLQASEGAVQTGGSIIVNQLLLGGDVAKESTGDFDLQQANSISQLSARLVDSLQLVNAIDLLIVKSSYTSICDPMQSEDFGVDGGDADMDPGVAGLNIGNGLALTVSGNIEQTDAPVFVAGATVLEATGNICLVGGDCDGDGNTDNDFNTLEIVGAFNAEIADANDLTIVSANVVNQLWLVAGDDDSTIGDDLDGQLTFDGDIFAFQALLQASEGAVQDSGIISVNQLLIGGDDDKESNGEFVLTGNNAISEIAGTIQDSLMLVNTVDLLVVKAVYASVCDPMQIEDFAGLDIGANLDITVAGGSLGQINAPVIVDGATRLEVGDGNICLVGGDCNGDGNTDNDFNTLEIVNAINAEVLDVNDLIIVSATVADQLWLAAGDGFEDNNDNGLLDVGEDVNGNGVLDTAGKLTINGNLSSRVALLQASQGLEQTSGTVVVDELLLGGDELKEGRGLFTLVEDGNQISYLAGELEAGTLQLANETNLTVLNLEYISVCSPETEVVSRLFAGGAGSSLETNLQDQLVDLSGTAQAQDNLDSNGDPGSDGQSDFNANFQEYLTGSGLDGSGTPSDIGIAIINDGRFLNRVEVTAASTDILIQTNGTSDLDIGPFNPDGDVPIIDANVTVESPTNHILLIAGGNLELQSDLVRGLGAGVVSDELNISPTFIIDIDGVTRYFHVVDPGAFPGATQLNALVDTANLTQDVTLRFGSFGEANFDFTVFWGIEGIANSGALPFLEFASLSDLEALLGTGFESRSFYLDGTDELIVPGVDPSFGDIDFEVRSLPDDVANDPDATFTLDFLRNNSQFRNLLMVFNDSNINIFEQANDVGGINGENSVENLVDLNVSAEEFIGLARIGEPPQIVVDLPEFIVPTRIDVAPSFEAESFQSEFVPEENSFVPTVRDKFFVVVYFENQSDADYFQDEFGEGEQDFSEKIRQLLKQNVQDENGFDNTRWSTDTEDVNKIREILEAAKLDLDENEKDLLEELKIWLQSEEKDKLEIPRGLYKIIVVEDGKAVIEGDDIDRRFVPEPVEDDREKSFKFEDKKDFEYLDKQSSSSRLEGTSDRFGSNRLERWQAILSGESIQYDAVFSDETAVTTTTELGNDFESNSTASASLAGVGAASLLSVLRRQRSGEGKSQVERINSLELNRNKRLERNVFSSVARLFRRISS